MKEKDFIYIARVVSLITTPFYLPIVALCALFFFSYMSRLPLWYKAFVVMLVYLFTILIPTILINLYRNYHGWKPIELGQREKRMVPYLLSIICYFVCYYLMNSLRMPSFISRILMAALFIQMVCAVINIWWKISTHTAAIGGMTGGVMAFSLLYGFNPIWWISLLIILSGIVGTSRMILRQHTLSQVVGAFFVGFFCAFITIF